MSVLDAWVVRIAGIVTILAGLIGALVWGVNWLRQRSATLLARGEYFNFHLPKPIQQSFQTLLDALNPSQMKMYLASDWTDAQRMEAAMSLYKYLEGAMDPTLRQGLVGYSSAWKFTIVNRGAKEVADLVLESELQGVYTLQRDGTEAESGSFKHRIPLGALRGANAVTVTVLAWFVTGSVWEEKDIRVTHPQGRVHVQFPRRSWFIPGGLVRLFARKPARWG